LTNRTIGSYVGEENHTLITAEMPVHNHVINISDPGHVHQFYGRYGSDYLSTTSGSTTFGAWFEGTNLNTNTSTSSTGISSSSNNTGSGSSHNNIQPTLFTGNLFIYSGV